MRRQGRARPTMGANERAAHAIERAQTGSQAEHMLSNNSFAAWRAKVAQSISRGSPGMTVPCIACISISRTWIVCLTAKKPLHEAATETLWYLFNFVLLCSPHAAVRSGQTLANLHGHICIFSHIARSCSLALISLGLVPFMETAHTMLRLHMEVAIEAALASQDQLSFPIMALLHAVRQAAWMSIVVWRMGHDPYHGCIRGLCNWALLCLLSYVFERRMWASYKEHCRTIQRQQDNPAQKAKQAATSGEPAAATDSSDRTAAGASGAEPAASAASTRPAATAVSAESAATSARGGAAARGDDSQAPSPPPEQNGADEGQAVLPLILRRDRAYVSPLGPHTIVCVKIRGVQLEQLPSNAGSVIQECAETLFPDTLLTSMAMRTGCVMITLDLYTCAWYMGNAHGGGVTLSDGIMNLVTHLMRNGMGRFLKDGATMYIQTPEELSQFKWNSSTAAYQAKDKSLLRLATCAAAGQLPRMLPATHCLATSGAQSAHPSNTPATGRQLDLPAQITMSVQLELPGNCQLHGWQPAGVAAPAVSDVGLQTVPRADAVVDAMLLARRLDGGYVPVVVERVARGDIDSGVKAKAHPTTVLVTISVGSTASAALCLELWCQATAAPTQDGGQMEQGPELLVSHMPLLVLPSSWKEAADELQQHIVETGGVQPRNALPPRARDVSRQESEGQSGCLLEDMGIWLTHHRHSAGRALPDSVVSQLGDALLAYAVRHGLGAVASMIVDTMQLSQHRDDLHSTNHPPCNDQESMELCEVIMAAGRVLKQPGSTMPMAIPSWTRSFTSPVA